MVDFSVFSSASVLEALVRPARRSDTVDVRVVRGGQLVCTVRLHDTADIVEADAVASAVLTGVAARG